MSRGSLQILYKNTHRGVWKEYGIYVYYKKVGSHFCLDSILSKQQYIMKIRIKVTSQVKY